MTANLHPIMQQALAPFAPKAPSINDDDVYVLDIRSRQIVSRVGTMSDWRNSKFPTPVGCAFVSGLQAKGLL